MRNVVAMGATIALINFDLELFNQVLRKNFGKKGEEVAIANVEAAKSGYDYAKAYFTQPFSYVLEKNPLMSKYYFMSGNEAIAAGAVKAGCTFMAAYPMTPATSVFTTFISQEKQFNLITKHTEDEIAAMNMAIGASYAGLSAMTATSGGGFALMTEALGLAAQTETPLVVVEAQRPGPATGMATHTGQGDLRFVMHASTDEFPRIIIAPTDFAGCFNVTQTAFNLAEKYQMVVIILTDKYLGESYISVPESQLKFIPVERGKLIIPNGEDSVSENYQRYSFEDDGISLRAVPGVKDGMHTASSYEHDEHGSEREDEDIRISMHNKRAKKYMLATKEINEIYAPQMIGNSE